MHKTSREWDTQTNQPVWNWQEVRQGLAGEAKFPPARVADHFRRRLEARQESQTSGQEGGR